MTARGQRGAALVIGGFLALLFSAIAAVQVAGWTVGAVEHSNHQVIPGPVSKLSVDAGAGGDITVVRELSDLPLVTIDSTVKGSIHAPVLRAVKDGATVRINGNCPYISFGPCHARIVIRVPADTEVDVRSGSGDVTAMGLSGTVDLETGSGDVNATGLTGDSDLHTSSGDVNVRAAARATRTCAPARATSTPRTSRRATWSPTPPRATSSSTSRSPRSWWTRRPPRATSTSPSRDGTYRVEDDPGSGKTHRNVKSDPAATRVIRAQTSSGDITVGYGN